MNSPVHIFGLSQRREEKVGQDLITGNKEFIRIEERTLALQEPHQVLIFIVQEWTM